MLHVFISPRVVGLLACSQGLVPGGWHGILPETMVVRQSLWIYVDSRTGRINVVPARALLHQSLELLQRELPAHVRTILSSDPQRPVLHNGSWLVPTVIPPGYCVITIWSPDFQFRFHPCRASQPDNLQVWNGLMATFWADDDEQLPVADLDAQVQRDVRWHLERGGEFSAIRYRPAIGDRGPDIDTVANQATLAQLRDLLTVAFAHRRLAWNQPGTFAASTIRITVTPEPRGRLDNPWVLLARLYAEDGARYYILHHEPYFGTWDGILAEGLY